LQLACFHDLIVYSISKTVENVALTESMISREID